MTRGEMFFPFAWEETAFEYEMEIKIKRVKNC